MPEVTYKVTYTITTGDGKKYKYTTFVPVQDPPTDKAELRLVLFMKLFMANPGAKTISIDAYR